MGFILVSFHIYINRFIQVTSLHFESCYHQDALANGQQNARNQNPFAMGFSAYFIYIVVYRYKIVRKVVMDACVYTHRESENISTFYVTRIQFVF